MVHKTHQLFDKYFPSVNLMLCGEPFYVYTDNKFNVDSENVTTIQ